MNTDNLIAFQPTEASASFSDLPERTIVTGVGAVDIQVPKVRDRTGRGIKFLLRTPDLTITPISRRST